VGHSTLNRVLLAVALGVPLRDYRRRFRQDWANLTVLRHGSRYGGGWQLLLANDVAHLRGITGATWD
jgi:broad specificity phosphatase PhoE